MTYNTGDVLYHIEKGIKVTVEDSAWSITKIVYWNSKIGDFKRETVDNRFLMTESEWYRELRLTKINQVLGERI